MNRKAKAPLGLTQSSLPSVVKALLLGLKQSSLQSVVKALLLGLTQSSLPSVVKDSSARTNTV